LIPKYGGSGFDRYFVCCGYDRIAKVDASAAVIYVSESLVCAGLENIVMKSKNEILPLAKGKL
jgi:hypothetical protein